MAEPNPKEYLEYLDKEMTIMGLLSTFSVLVVGLAMNSVLGAEHGELKNLWPQGHWYLLGGSLWILVAALMFYRQRSLLAYYYGQIALCHVQGASGEFENVKSALADADAWITWLFYQTGFASLIVGVFGYGMALLSILMPVLRRPEVIIGFTLLGGVSALGFAILDHRRLTRIDHAPREERRSGWIVRPSHTHRPRKG